MICLVAGVVIQDGKVLLIQECKISFKNKWYLPAGRMERGESIVVRRWEAGYPLDSDTT